MNKKLKILVINIVLILVLLIAAELCLCVKETYDEILKKENKAITIERLLTEVKECAISQYFQYGNNFYYLDDFREPSIKHSDKPAVMFFGCSYTYGANLDEKDTVAAQFSDLTGATAYNLGLVGGGVREILHILRNRDILRFQNTDTHNIEYVIYTYIGDHQYRIFSNRRSVAPKFKEKNGKLYEQKIKYPFIDKTFIKKYLLGLYFDKIIMKFNVSMSWQKMVLYLKEINREIKNTFDNNGKETRFIILVYAEFGNENWSDLENENIQIIKLEELSDIIRAGELPWIVWEGDDHPSKLVWETVLPELIKKMDL